MERIKEIISSKNIKSVSDYFNVYKLIEQAIVDNRQRPGKEIKIAIVSSFTAFGIKETLFVKCCELGVLPKFYQSDYNQYFQEIVNPSSNLYKFNPDLIIVFIETKSLLGEEYFLSYYLTGKQRSLWVDEKLNEMQALIRKIKENSSAKVLFHNFEVPFYSPLGIHENKQEFGFTESIEKVNADLTRLFKKDNQVFIFDYESFCSRIGKRNIINHKMYYLADIRLNLEYVPELCNDYLSLIKPLVSAVRKCIVLDLDNTIWGGIIGEEGLEGIKLGPTDQGKAFWDFQKYLLSLFSRGIILAINSTNNYEDVLKVFREHPYMVLKEEHFAAIQVNWNDKISNIRAIAEEINIGLDSMVFIDDSKVNRDMIKRALPEVLVVDLPEDPSLYLKKLTELNDFNTLQLTDEDIARGRIYSQQRKRRELQGNIVDITEYLKALDMVVEIERACPFNIPRISQLTQKTNQFNTTTRRYQEEDVRRFSENDNFLTVCINVKDKFGDNGITGVAVVEKGSREWRIDTFLLSCRIIGRRIEEVLLGYIIQRVRKADAEVLIGEFIPTKKNMPAREFFLKNNFKLLNKVSEREIWVYDVARDYKCPDFFQVIERS